MRASIMRCLGVSFAGNNMTLMSMSSTGNGVLSMYVHFSVAGVSINLSVSINVSMFVATRSELDWSISSRV